MSPLVSWFRQIRRVALCVALFLVAPLLLESQNQNDSDEAWLRDNYQRALDDLIPLRKPVDAGGVYVSYRPQQTLFSAIGSDKSSDSSEYSFRLGWDPNVDGKPGLLTSISAHIRIASGVTVRQQLLRLHRAAPQADLDSLEPKIKIEKIDLTEKECPSIHGQMDKFKAARLRMPEFFELILDPVVHEFQIEAGTGNMHISLVDDKYELVRWAQETRHVLNACGSQKNGKTVR